jgi:hypothetical protein
MKMGDSLSGVRPVVGDDPIAAVMEPGLGGDARCQSERVRRDVPIVNTDFTQGREVLPWHDEHVHRRLRVEVAEGDVVLALGDELRTELTARDATEDAIGNGRVIQVHRFRHSARVGNRPVVRSQSLQPWPLKRATAVRVCQFCPGLCGVGCG